MVEAVAGSAPHSRKKLKSGEPPSFVPCARPWARTAACCDAVPVEELGATVARAVVQRTGLDPARIEDVIFAQSYSSGETPCTGRWVALQAGFPIEVAGMQLDRRCGGGVQAIATAAMMVQTGAADVVMAGGVESMSNVEYYTTDMRWGKRAGSVKLHDRLERGRERSQPESALRTHQRHDRDG